MRALIIENNPAHRDMLSHSLAEQGFDNDTGDSIELALEYAESGIYDIICVDQDLSDGSGEQFVEFCNRHERHRNTPILFLTEDTRLAPQDLSVKVEGVIHKLNRHQIENQIIHFIDLHLDPVFHEGRILFVEDNAEIAEVILMELEETGYDVTYFATAEQGWAEFEKVEIYGSHPDAYDLVITDVNLGGSMSGPELIGRIRQIEDGRGFVPIMAITSDSCDQLRISLYQQGVNDFLQKPILPQELLVRINNLMTNKRLLDKVHDIRRELYALATTDELTGCHNRHSMMEFSEKFIAQAVRHDYPVSMLVIDLDHFKSINDNHGHAVGDTVLKQTGALLNRSFREGDLVTRYGGEEFVVLMPHCGSEDAVAKAEELRVAVENLHPEGLDITTSIGVSTMEKGVKCDFEALFHAGDEGVYKAKENGRNQVVYVPAQSV